MTDSPRRAPVPSTPWRTFQEEMPAKSGPLGGLFGGVAIAVGLGVLGIYMLDLHGHRCCRCGNRWRHFGAFNLGDEVSHTCSSCGEVQWWKDGVPHVLRGSQFVERPSNPALPSPQPVDVLAAALVPLGLPPPAPLAIAARAPLPNTRASHALPAGPQSPMLAIRPRRAP